MTLAVFNFKFAVRKLFSYIQHQRALSSLLLSLTDLLLAHLGWQIVPSITESPWGIKIIEQNPKIQALNRNTTDIKSTFLQNNYFAQLGESTTILLYTFSRVSKLVHIQMSCGIFFWNQLQCISISVSSMFLYIVFKNVEFEHLNDIESI